MWKFPTRIGGKAEDCNPKLAAARAKLAKDETESEKLIDTLTGATPLLSQNGKSG